MNNILYTKKKNPTYENFEAECPYCFHFNIYNRATDFKTFNPVSFKTVKCQNKDCKKCPKELCKDYHERILSEQLFYLFFEGFEKSSDAKFIFIIFSELLISTSSVKEVIREVSPSPFIFLIEEI